MAGPLARPRRSHGRGVPGGRRLRPGTGRVRRPEPPLPVLRGDSNRRAADSGAVRDAELVHAHTPFSLGMAGQRLAGNSTSRSSRRITRPRASTPSTSRSTALSSQRSAPAPRATNAGSSTVPTPLSRQASAQRPISGSLPASMRRDRRSERRRHDRVRTGRTTAFRERTTSQTVLSSATPAATATRNAWRTSSPPARGWT